MIRKTAVSLTATLVLTAGAAQGNVRPTNLPEPTQGNATEAADYLQVYSDISERIFVRSDAAVDRWWNSRSKRTDRSAVRNMRNQAWAYQRHYRELQRDSAQWGRCRSDILANQRNAWRSLVKRTSAYSRNNSWRRIVTADYQVGYQRAWAQGERIRVVACLLVEGWRSEGQAAIDL